MRKLCSKGHTPAVHAVCRLAPLAVVAGLAGASAAQVAVAPGPFAGIPNATGYQLPGGGARLVIPGPTVIATLGGGEIVPMETQAVWKPVCSNRGAMTAVDLATMVTTHNADFADATKVTVVDRGRGGGNTRAGLDVVFVLGPSVPAAAIPAFAAAEAYLESQFTADAMTVTVPVSFASLGSGIIGGTGSSYGTASWTSSRSLIVGGMDASDTIQSSLPTASLPVRYGVNTTTAENRVFWTFANWKANGGTIAGNDASMQYSTNFPFDYDPSNGVTANTISLQDVIIHETGHALGCTSGVDFRSKDIEAMDIFRFRRTDGNGDFNPDTAAEFTARPRWAVRNNPNDDVNFDDLGATEYRFSDGSPWQASHWREQVPAIGIMDPAFSYGETFYPNFLMASDLTMFDAIGYNR